MNLREASRKLTPPRKAPDRPPADPPPVQPEKGRRPSDKRQLSVALQRIATRGLQTTEDEIRAYQPTELAVAVAEAMLSGCVTFKAMAKHLSEAYDQKIGPDTISKCLRDPTTCAWVSRQVHQAIGLRLGLVDMAMLERAIAGNVAAAKLLYQRYDEIMRGGSNAKVQINMFDPTKLTNEQLENLTRAQVRKMNLADE